MSLNDVFEALQIEDAKSAITKAKGIVNAELEDKKDCELWPVIEGLTIALGIIRQYELLVRFVVGERL